MYPSSSPFDFLVGGAVVDHARQDEQQVRQPVYVREQLRFHVVLAEGDNAPLGPTTHGSGEMECGARTAPAWEDEAPQGWQLRLEAVDPFLETADISLRDRRLCHSGGNPIGRIRKLGAHGEEVVLQVAEHVQQVGFKACLGPHDPEPCVELVYLAICLHARIAFQHARAAEQAGVPPVSGAGVDLHRGQYMRTD